MDNRIKDALRDMGITQAELAKRLGVTRVAVCQYCRHPTLTTLTKIAHALGCDVRDLLPAPSAEASAPAQSDMRVVNSFTALVVIDGCAHSCASPDEVITLCNCIRLGT